MTNEARLFHAGRPGLHLIVLGESPFEDLSLRLASEHRQAVVRKIRGGKSRTVADFFDEIGAALQFPYYFGENWPALDECITDLDWLEGAAYLLMITDADLLLIDDHPEDFRVLLEIFSRANKEWLTPNAYIPRNREPTPFHVLFQCEDQEKLSTLSRRMERAGAEFEILTAG